MTDFNQRYIDARRAVIARDFQRLNPMQRQAAMTTEGPLLLLAGAGSGKTTVLIQRVYNLLTYGRGSDTNEVPQEATEEDLAFLEQFPDQPTPEEKRRAIWLCAVDVPRPWEIIAITFTNKAAGELKDRLAAWAPPPTTSGPPPSTPPACGSCGGTSTASALTRTSPSTILTTPSG